PPTSSLFPYTTLFRSTCSRSDLVRPALGALRRAAPHGLAESPLRVAVENRHVRARLARARARDLRALPAAGALRAGARGRRSGRDRKSTRLNSSHVAM